MLLCREREGVNQKEKLYVYHQVFCLGNPHDDRPPSSLGAHTALSNAGLGPATLVI